jgi:aminoglycoside 2''-phosphotransferase
MTEKLAAYLEKIRCYEPEFIVDEAVINEEGLVNDVVVINGEVVFRFPKHDWAVAHLKQEAKCLALARRFVEMPLPQWTVYDDYCISYRWTAGVALQRFHILLAESFVQETIAEQLGLFLHQLHTIPKTAVQQADIGQSVTVRTQEDWLKLYEDVQRDLFPIMMKFSQEWVHHHFAPVVENPVFMCCEPVFMNGDLGPYHLLYDPQMQCLNGIIDFGTAGVGDPATDFACLLDQYGETFVWRVAKFYPDFDEALLERARFWAGTLRLQWLLGGLRYPDEPDWFAVHIGRARDVLPVGSGWQQVEIRSPDDAWVGFERAV